MTLFCTGIRTCNDTQPTADWVASRFSLHVDSVVWLRFWLRFLPDNKLNNINIHDILYLCCMIKVQVKMFCFKQNYKRSLLVHCWTLTRSSSCLLFWRAWPALPTEVAVKTDPVSWLSWTPVCTGHPPSASKTRLS
jgi:hypothetical protein